MKAKPRQTCTDHCVGCGQHFHGMGAFEDHLKRVNEHQNRWDARSYQLEHQDGVEASLEAWTTSGLCQLSYPSQEGVTIWRRPLTEQAKARLAAMSGKADSGLGSSRSGSEEAIPVLADVERLGT